MAMFRDDAGKTEQPTPTRLREASDKGQVPTSREFTMAATLLIVTITLLFSGGWLIDSLAEALKQGLDVRPDSHLVDGASVPAASGEILHLLQIIAKPFLFLFGMFVLATAIGGYGQIGLHLRKNALRLQLERLDPVANLGKLISLSSVMRTLLSVLKLSVLGAVLYFVLAGRMPLFAKMYESDEFAESVGMIADTAFLVLTWVSLLVLVISLADLAWQRFDYIRNLKMTKQEVDDERKRNDGDPLIKSRIRQAALELSRQRMMEAIPTADVVIINPTHFSVALRYDRQKHAAPEVVAKGTDEAALRIRELAREHDVPLMEDPPLARALCRTVKVGQQVPEKFYKAVAAVLSHVFRLKERVA